MEKALNQSLALKGELCVIFLPRGYKMSTDWVTPCPPASAVSYRKDATLSTTYHRTTLCYGPFSKSPLRPLLLPQCRPLMAQMDLREASKPASQSLSHQPAG